MRVILQILISFVVAFVTITVVDDDDDDTYAKLNLSFNYNL
jgi:hypothetical protein